MVEGFGLLKSTRRRRWKKQQQNQQDKQPLNISTNPTDVDDAGSLISIVDDRLYQGYHPEADPFSMARVQSRSFQPNGTSTTIKKDSSSPKITKFISKSSKGADPLISTSCHSPIKSRSTHQRLSYPSNSLRDETEDIGVYAQRDVIIGPHPLYNFLQETTHQQERKDNRHILQPILLSQNDGRPSDSGSPETTPSSTAPRDYPATPEVSDAPSTQDDNCTVVTSAGATTTSIATNNNITCLLDMLASICIAVSPAAAVRKVSAVSNFNNCTAGAILLRQRLKATPKDDDDDDDDDDCAIPPVQSHRRRHKIVTNATNTGTNSDEPCERDQAPSVKDDVDEYRQGSCSSNHQYHYQQHQQRVMIVPGRSPVPTDQNDTTVPVVSSAAVVTSVAVYPIARYSDRLNSTELVERRRKSLQKFLTFQPVVPSEDEQFNLLSKTNSNLSMIP